LTTSRYYTPTGRSIQKPYNLSEDKEYYESFYKRYENGELINADSIKVNDSLKFTTPKGKIVYGGGGIVPDVFVSIDTTRMIERKYFTQMNEFVFNYIDKNREELRGWSLKRFNTEFKNNNKLLNEYLRMIDIVGPISDHKKSIIERYLKESIAEQIFSEDDYSRILNKDDKMINEVMKLELTN
jgi:carboxyl-terminal processing protease